MVGVFTCCGGSENTDRHVSTENSGDVGPKQEIRDQRALTVYNRVRDKLAGGHALLS